MIFVAAHKNFEFYPLDKELYKTIEVGAYNDRGLVGFDFKDSEGDNISTLNSSFCEMTAIYWFWKNLKSDFYGLNHYRRYFTVDKKYPLSKAQLENILSKYDAILPKKRNYVVDTVYSHYKHSHHIDDLLLARKVIEENYPDYIDSFDKVMNNRKLCLYNMFLYDKEFFNSYCEWLFDILLKLSDLIVIDDYTPYQSRVIGFIAERLHNVYLEKNAGGMKILYLDTLEPESESKVVKAKNLLKRKLLGKKL
ncbi:DUF4422 domain-containing protein [Pseudoalteromonas gelatinilytica]